MKHQNIILALALFAGFILVITGLDHVVNCNLYQHGLQYNLEWYTPYSTLYFLLYQLVIAALALPSIINEYTAYRRVSFGFVALYVWMETFVLSCTQDLFFYMVWCGGFPEGDWAWMPFYKIFGTWRTEHQILLSFLCLTVVSLVLFMIYKRRK